jgi:ABC-2 type transport system permease protein
MNRLQALLRREYWENRIAFVATPVAIAILHLVGMLMAIVTTVYFDNDLYTVSELLRVGAETPLEMRSFIVENALIGTAGLFTVVQGFVVFFYLLGSLYDDRKDRSILFWKSLPASDTLTLASKLLTAMLVVPLIFWLLFVATQVVIAAFLSLMVLYIGGNPWELFLSVANPLSAWGMVLLTYLAMAVWALPLYGWLMLVSAFSPRVPLLFAVLPPVVVAVLQLWLDFLKTFTFRDNLFGVIGQWFANAPIILSANSDGEDSVEIALGIPLGNEFDHAVTVANIFDRLFSSQMLFGLLFAAACLGATLWLRRRATDN